MKKVNILILSLFLFQSCGIQYDGQEKLEIVGKLVDKNGIGIANEKVNVKVGEGGYELFGGTSLETISYGNTNSEGKFQFVIPSPIGERSLSLDFGNNYNSDKTIFFKKSNFINYKLDLNKIVYYNNSDITNLQIILNYTNSNKQVSDIKVEGIVNEPIINLNPEPINEIYNSILFFSVIKNQNIVLKYKIKDFSNNGSIQEFSETISIIESSINFTITY
jgi:hypothetical protein